MTKSPTVIDPSAIPAAAMIMTMVRPPEIMKDCPMFSSPSERPLATAAVS